MGSWLTFYKTFDSVMTIMIASAIAATNEDKFQHHVFNKTTQRWLRRGPRKSPVVKFGIRVDKGAIQDLKMRNINIQTMSFDTFCMTDTGASVCIGGPNTLQSLGITEDHLTKCEMTIYGADDSDIQLLGVVPVWITDRSSGRQTRQFLYICKKSPRNILLSLEACIDLGYVDSNFPSAQEEEAVKSINKEETWLLLPTLDLTQLTTIICIHDSELPIFIFHLHLTIYIF